ncbi:PepSY-associated TM helix domain-containing protein [Colwellia sp. TT2012]|uniref:PepSY-associated TM helix domain-containing protein n=1 Tax=Colwellia sp. TT2012 TaxID=1720342 RepID=UPI0009EB4680|nr:PepSY-associated TM helix domain-containing protein [Colwellia sp. TT2012]
MMKRDALKALTNAHAWVGLIISTILFIIFFAGSLSLFREDIISWERDPYFVSSESGASFSIDAVISQVVNDYQVNTHGYFILQMPTDEQPSTNIYFEEKIPAEEQQEHALDKQLDDHIDRHLIISPDGKVLGDGNAFDWGNFLYQLHYNLHIPEVGLYFVGVVTLFFFVALLSGVVIHWRKIIAKFFQYRKDGKKDKLLDAHNLIGVMGLPFHLMYAFSGLVFNLLIVYQISYAVVLYGGDQGKLFKAAGVVDVHLDESNVAIPVQGLDKLLLTAKLSLGQVTIIRMSIDHFGDESASVTFRGDDKSQFSTRKEVTYHIASGRELYLTKNNYDNDIRGGLAVIASLHFGDFAGYSLRMLFFVLGIGTCYIILTGNLMWLQKRANLRSEKQNKLGLQLVKAMTTGGFIGTIFATAVGFICARLLPIDLLDRSDLIGQIFFACLAASLIVSLLIKAQQQFAAIFLKITALALALIPVLDWLMLSQGIVVMFKAGHFDVLIVEVMLLSLALCCWLVSSRLFSSAEAVVNEQPISLNDLAENLIAEGIPSIKVTS